MTFTIPLNDPFLMDAGITACLFLYDLKRRFGGKISVNDCEHTDPGYARRQITLNVGNDEQFVTVQMHERWLDGPMVEILYSTDSGSNKEFRFVEGCESVNDTIDDVIEAMESDGYHFYK